MRSHLILVVLSILAACVAGFDEFDFRERVKNALETVKVILETTRNPQLAEHEEHVYQDKYDLAEYMTNTAIASYVAALKPLGISDDVLKVLLGWSHESKRFVSLQFAMERSCTFVKADKVKVTVAEYEVEQSGSVLGSTKKNEKHSIFVDEYHWLVKYSYKLRVYPGTGIETADNNMDLITRQPSTTVITRTKQAPFTNETWTPKALLLSWPLQNMSPEIRSCQFAIDRTNPNCKTPRRNDDVQKALDFASELLRWSTDLVDKITSMLDNNYFPPEDVKEKDNTYSQTQNKLAELWEISNNLFVPILPLMENGTVVFRDIDTLLAEQERQIQASILKVTSKYDADVNTSLLGRSEAIVYIVAMHLINLTHQHEQGMAYIENMLETQLIKAIGKRIGSRDFDNFMGFHSKALLDTSYATAPFSRAIRQPKRYPDGILSIEDSEKEIINTLIRPVANASTSPTVRIPISSATSVEISGDIFLHGWIQNRFEKEHDKTFTLAARARQFSSFLLVIGTMTNAEEFTPKHAIVLQNKDEVLIPLLTEVLPSARAFKDAIASLSPEQQAFAKMFRSMQLQSSVFGICVIQLKPQLEKLLNLPNGALKKEIQLMQDLMTLFIEYQIPSDLLSYDGAVESESSEKINAVKGHVKVVLEVIEATKKKQLGEQETIHMMHKARMLHEQPDKRQYFAQARSAGAADSFAYNAVPEFQASTVPGLEYIDRPETMDDMDMLMSQDMLMEAQDRESRGPDDMRHADNDVMSQSDGKAVAVGEDFTLIPKVLDARLETYDTDGALRSTIIKAETDGWQLRSQPTLLDPVSTAYLSSSEIEIRKKHAFDLLDAISRSGTLSIDASELHVIIAVSHCFEQSIMETVIQQNVNPVEKVERSLLLLGSVIHNVSPSHLLGDKSSLDRLKGAFPELFDGFTVDAVKGAIKG